MDKYYEYFVYILKCNDDSYYIGVTNNLERRLQEHNSGQNISCYTFGRRPVELKHFEKFQNVKEAIAREKQLKGWSRKKKEALFHEDWEELKRLAKNRITHPSTSSG